MGKLADQSGPELGHVFINSDISVHPSLIPLRSFKGFAMAQTYQLSKTICPALPSQNTTASQSTALLPSRSNLRKKTNCHGVRAFPSHQLCRVDPIGRNLNLHTFPLSSRSHLFMPENRFSNSNRSQRKRDSAVVHAQAVPVPRSVSFLPGAGPLRDFLFALIGAVFAFLFAGVLARVWCLEERYFRATSAERGTATMPEMGSNQGQKESVEWVNMVIHKVWKVYRRSLQGWLIQLLQPAIDNLGKPHWVKRVKIAELNLDYEPIIVRTVQRRASRCVSMVVAPIPFSCLLNVFYNGLHDYRVITLNIHYLFYVEHSISFLSPWTSIHAEHSILLL